MPLRSTAHRYARTQPATRQLLQHRCSTTVAHILGPILAVFQTLGVGRGRQRELCATNVWKFREGIERKVQFLSGFSLFRKKSSGSNLNNGEVQYSLQNQDG